MLRYWAVLVKLEVTLLRKKLLGPASHFDSCVVRMPLLMGREQSHAISAHIYIYLYICTYRYTHKSPTYRFPLFNFFAADRAELANVLAISSVVFLAFFLLR